eukprot:2598254-Amphidinium_carterae.1
MKRIRALLQSCLCRASHSMRMGTESGGSHGRKSWCTSSKLPSSKYGVTNSTHPSQQLAPHPPPMRSSCTPCQRPTANPPAERLAETVNTGRREGKSHQSECPSVLFHV